FFLSGNLCDDVDERFVRPSRFWREAWLSKPEIIAAKRCRFINRAGQKTLAKGSKRNEADAELLKCRQNISLRLPPPKRVFALQRGNRLNGMGPVDCVHPGFRKSKVPDFAFRDEIFHRASYIFDRHVRINAMLIEEIDHIGPEASE